MPSDRAVLEFDHVTKMYSSGDTKVYPLRDVDLRIMEEEVVVIMGPSGAGKTTLLTIAGALLRPTSGSVCISGINITDLDERKLPRVRQEKIGFIFQHFNLLEALTALENVELAMSMRGMADRAARARAEELLAVVGIADRLHHTPNTLSGGQKQRVAIARALANNPELVLADEPIANLDSRRGKEIMELLKMLARGLGKTIVAVSHDLETRQSADRVLWLEDGQIKDITDEPGTLLPP